MATSNPNNILENRNIRFLVGNIEVLQKMENEYRLISGIFGNTPTRHKDFLEQAKLLLYNRLNESISVHQIIPTSSIDFFETHFHNLPFDSPVYTPLAIRCDILNPSNA
jgi:hypothetical protein